eukprot:6854298-Pyramimonas_sp.AAC.1
MLASQWDDVCFSGPSCGSSWTGHEASWTLLGAFEKHLEPSETPEERRGSDSGPSLAAVTAVWWLSAAVMSPPPAGQATGSPHLCCRGRGPGAPRPGSPARMKFGPAAPRC